MKHFTFIKTAYYDLVVKREKDAHFWMFVSFLITFILLRLLVYLVVYGKPHFFINIRGTHIHHLTFGIFLLSIVGYAALTDRSKKLTAILSVLYGVALALAFDEFGMWLHLKDNYWIRQSYDAILVISIWFINTVYFSDFWLKIFNHIFRRKNYKPKH